MLARKVRRGPDALQGGARGVCHCSTSSTTLHTYLPAHCRSRAAVISIQGQRKYMEDTYQAIPSLSGHSTWSYYGVYDGHGGARCSVYVAHYLHKHVLAWIDAYIAHYTAPTNTRRLIEQLAAHHADTTPSEPPQPDPDKGKGKAHKNNEAAIPQCIRKIMNEILLKVSPRFHLVAFALLLLMMRMCRATARRTRSSCSWRTGSAGRTAARRVCCLVVPAKDLITELIEGAGAGTENKDKAQQNSGATLLKKLETLNTKQHELQAKLHQYDDIRSVFRATFEVSDKVQSLLSKLEQVKTEIVSTRTQLPAGSAYKEILTFMKENGMSQEKGNPGTVIGTVIEKNVIHANTMGLLFAEHIDQDLGHEYAALMEDFAVIYWGAEKKWKPCAQLLDTHVPEYLIFLKGLRFAFKSEEWVEQMVQFIARQTISCV